MATSDNAVCGVGLAMAFLLLFAVPACALRHNYEMTLAIAPEDGQFCTGDTVTFTATDTKSGATLDDVTIKVYLGDDKVATLETGNDGNSSYRMAASGAYEVDAFRRNYMDVVSTFTVENCSSPSENDTASVNVLPPKNTTSPSNADTAMNASNTSDVPAEPGNGRGNETPLSSTSSTLTTSLTTSLPTTTLATTLPPTSSTLAPTTAATRPTTSVEADSLLDIDQPRVPVFVFLILIFCIGVLLFLYFGILQTRKEERTSKLGGKIQDLPSNIARKAKSTLKKK